MTWNTTPNKNYFLNLCSTNKIIPIVTKQDLGNHTPVSLYQALGKNKDYSFLLESGLINGKDNRYSFIGYNPSKIFKSKNNCIEITEKKKIKFTGTPLVYLQDFLEENIQSNFEYAPIFYGGFIAFFAYETVRMFEDIPINLKDDLNIPDLLVLKFDKLIVIDHLSKKLSIIVCAKNNLHSYRKALSEIEEEKKKIEENNYTSDEIITDILTNLDINCNKVNFVNMVNVAKKYIEEGDIYQANLSQRFQVTYSKDPFNLYKKIIAINPSPFAAFFKAKDTYLVSCSPERLLKVEKNIIETRPIAGTRPRGKNMEEDSLFSNELLLNEKERAEHLMLVDLERNDLGKVCKFGSVNVNEFMSLEKYSHVWHIVSNIKGALKNDIKFIDLLKACFPGGTITGCPKIRSMEIITELEKRRRGYYTGSLGYIGYNGNIDLNILIRTIYIKNKKAYFNVGAGIVADSSPEKEYYETLYKAKAMMEALDISEDF